MGKARQRDSHMDIGPGYRGRVQDEGAGDVLVLIHGTPLDSRVWDPLVPLLRVRHRVVRYDVRGHGTARSATVPESFTPLADDVVTLLDKLAVHRAHVVGHSWGGMIAQCFALVYPRPVEPAVAGVHPLQPLPGLPRSRDGHARHWAHRP